jgi:hypothetical protein
MKSIYGRPRVLTDAQVQTIIMWGRRRIAWRAHLRTKTDVATSLGVGRRAFDGAIERSTRLPHGEKGEAHAGRPPCVADPSIVGAILAWHARAVELEAALSGIRTFAHMAKTMKVSPATVERVIASGGHYKQASAETLAQARAECRERVTRLRQRLLYSD